MAGNSSDLEDQHVDNVQRRERSAAGLCELLQCTTEPERRRVANQAQNLLTAPPERLQQRLQHLAQLLGGDEAAAKLICRRTPALLALSEEALALRIQSLQLQLAIHDSEQLTKVLKACSSLPTLTPEMLRYNLQALSDALGGLPAAARACRSQPSLPNYDVRTVERNMQRLQSLFGGGDAALQACSEQPSLLAWDPANLERNAKGLQQLLGLQDGDQLAKVTRYVPALLSSDLESLRDRMRRIEEELGMQHSEVQELCISHPAVLTTSTEAILAKVRAHCTCLTGLGWLVVHVNEDIVISLSAAAAAAIFAAIFKYDTRTLAAFNKMRLCTLIRYIHDVPRSHAPYAVCHACRRGCYRRTQRPPRSSRPHLQLAGG